MGSLRAELMASPTAPTVLTERKLVVVSGSSGIGRQVAAVAGAVVIGQHGKRVSETEAKLSRYSEAYGIATHPTERMEPDCARQQLADDHADATSDSWRRTSATRPCTASMQSTRSAGPAPPAIWPTSSPNCYPRPPAASRTPSGTSTAASRPDATNTTEGES